MTAALYRLPWYLDLAHRSRGAGYSVHAAALSRVKEAGGTVLPLAELHLALGTLPNRLRKIVVTALVGLGLWAEVAGVGYEVREAPGEVRPSPTLDAEQRRREQANERKRKQRDRERDIERDTPPSDSVTSSVTERDASPVPSSSLNLPEEKKAEKQGKKEEEGMQGGPSAVAVTLDVTADVTRSVTPTVPTPAPSVTDGVTGSAMPALATAPAVQPALPGLPPPPPANVSPASEAKAARVRKPKAEPKPEPVVSAEVREVFGYWRERLAPKGQLLPERIQTIEAAFKAGLSVDDCKLAVDGCAKSDWNRETGNIDLTLILRPTKIERYLALGRGEIKPSASGGPASRSAPIQPADPGPFVRRWGKTSPIDDDANWTEDGEWIGPPELDPTKNDPTRKTA